MLNHFTEILVTGYEKDMTLHPLRDSSNFNLPKEIYNFVHLQWKHTQKTLHRN